MKSYFGEISESVELISRRVTDNELIETNYKIGKLMVMGISNIPSENAINHFTDRLDRLTEKILNGSGF